ncbi:uncharacterized protein LOC100377042 [Saccoglossus kowalevskii]|uniref:Uncharacterized protein LOC100377042 n=1 Tax=Saccoglossus kowalevskii TaxID=10224 RepID=A0ABM0GWQ3_SACKO|nr:PREDICTED: uncharacterized protein LOC100377042 [Saccoglossus kowalevskii]
MARSCYFCITCCWALIATVSSIRISTSTNGRLAYNYPNPQLNPRECGRIGVPVNTSWVCDPDGLLNFQQAEQLDSTLEVLRWNSRCECDKNCSLVGAYQVAIALVGRIGIQGNYVPDRERAHDFAEELRREWFDGQECQDNAVVFYAFTEKELYISIGPNTAKVVSDIELGQIYHHTTDYFHHPNVEDDSGESRLYEGLVIVLTDLHQDIDNEWFLTYGIVYAISVATATFVLFTSMCLIANCCVHFTNVKTENAF